MANSSRHGLLALLAWWGAACQPQPGLLEGQTAEVTVRFELAAPPILPLPNDILTRPDPRTPTGLRVGWPPERTTDTTLAFSERLSELDGWGLYGPISIPFTAEVDVQNVLERHP